MFRLVPRHESRLGSASGQRHFAVGRSVIAPRHGVLRELVISSSRGGTKK